jgi:hypothetical protein
MDFYRRKEMRGTGKQFVDLGQTTVSPLAVTVVCDKQCDVL